MSFPGPGGFGNNWLNGVLIVLGIALAVYAVDRELFWILFVVLVIALLCALLRDRR